MSQHLQDGGDAATQFSSRKKAQVEDKYSLEGSAAKLEAQESLRQGNYRAEEDDAEDEQAPLRGPLKRQMTQKEANAEKAFESIGIHVIEGVNEEDEEDENPIMRIEDDMERNEKCKDRIMRVLLFVCLCDALGAFLMIPISPRLYNNAPEGASQAEIDGGAGVFSEEAASFPLGGLPFALQVGQMCNLLGQAVAQATSGPLGHLTGRKNLLYIYTFGGAVAFFLSGASQQWGMYTYWGLRALTGLFGGSKPVVDSIIADMYADADPKVRMKKAMSPVMSILVAALLGPLLGMLLISTGLLFVPLHIGGALEVVAGLAVMVWVPNLQRKVPAEAHAAAAAAAEAAHDGEAAKKEQGRPGFGRWVAVFLAARFTDRTAGGQFMWLQSKGVQDFGEVALDMLPLIIVSMSFIGVLAMPASMRLSGVVGLAGVGAIGQAIAGGLFFVLASLQTFWGYAGVMLLLQAFTMMANMLVVPSITALVPPSRKDDWLGYMGAFAQLTQAFCPLILLELLNEELAGRADGLYLRVNGAVCFGSSLCYLLLICRLPRKAAPAAAATPEEEAAMRLFEATGETKRLTAKQLSGIQRQYLNEGKEMPIVRFGLFAEDKSPADAGGSELQRIAGLAEKDLEYLRSRTPLQVLQWKEGGEARAQIERRMKIIAGSNGGRWSAEGSAEIGAWFTDWLQYAGYLNPQTNPNMWKGLIMTAFPPMIPGGADDPEARRKVLENPVPLWLKIDRLYGQYLHMSKINARDVDSLCWLRTVQFQIAGCS